MFCPPSCIRIRSSTAGLDQGQRHSQAYRLELFIVFLRISELATEEKHQSCQFPSRCHPDIYSWSQNTGCANNPHLPLMRRQLSRALRYGRNISLEPQRLQANNDWDRTRRLEDNGLLVDHSLAGNTARQTKSRT
jgi:hypothetical protein